jgi:hypothetical protein
MKTGTNYSLDREAIEALAEVEADAYRLFGCSLADATAPRVARSSSNRIPILDKKCVLFQFRLPFGMSALVMRKTFSPTENVVTKGRGHSLISLAIRLWRRIAGKAGQHHQHPSVSPQQVGEAAQACLVRRTETSQSVATMLESPCLDKPISPISEKQGFVSQVCAGNLSASIRLHPISARLAAVANNESA